MAGNLEETVAQSAPDPAGVWWFAGRGVEKVYDEEEDGRREYETIPEEKTEANPLGIYTLTAQRIRHLSEEEVERRRRRAEDERAALYRAMYDDLGLSVVAYPDGTLEASWRFGAAVLRNGGDKSRNKHASRHFHATEHPLVRSFEPDEDWIRCFVDEVVMQRAS